MITEQEKQELFNDIYKKNKKLINFAANKFTHYSIANKSQEKDFSQEALISLWAIINKYPDKERIEIIKIWKTALFRQVSNFLRFEHYKKNTVNTYRSDERTQEYVIYSSINVTKCSDKVFNNNCYVSSKKVYQSLIEQDRNDVNEKFLEHLKEVKKDKHDKFAIDLFKELAFPSSEFLQFIQKRKELNNKKRTKLKVLIDYFETYNSKMYNTLKDLNKIGKSWLKTQNISV